MLKTAASRLILLLAISVMPIQTLAEEDDISLLFVQTSLGMKSDHEQRLLRLLEVDNQTVYFSDRPNRVAGHISLETFVNGWGKGENSFADNPPNAVLSVYEPQGEENTLVVLELFAPTKDSSDLVYSYRIIDGEMPESGGATALFIDTFGPGGGAGWAGVAVVNECEAEGNC